MLLRCLVFAVCWVGWLPLRASGRWVKEMENKDLHEGDMVLSPVQAAALASADKSYASIKTHLWPKKGDHVTVAYDITSTLEKDAVFMSAFNRAVQDYEKYTCIRFIPRSDEQQYIYIIKGNGCSSPVGTRGPARSNRISIGEGCQGKATIIHEIAHSLGFYHEQSRPDRDQYLTIHLENVPESWRHNFDKHSLSEIDSLGTKFDYRSVMHYGKTAFGEEGKLTLQTMDPYYTNLIGAASGFSAIDIQQFNKLYKCPAYTGALPTRQQTDTCYDIDSYCEFRQLRDGCTDLLKKICPFTCNQCLAGPTAGPTNAPHTQPPGTSSAPRTTVAPTTSAPPKCFDVRKDCAKKKRLCKSRKQIRKKCKKTCGLCN